MCVCVFLLLLFLLLLLLLLLLQVQDHILGGSSVIGRRSLPLAPLLLHPGQPALLWTALGAAQEQVGGVAEGGAVGVVVRSGTCSQSP